MSPPAETLWQTPSGQWRSRRLQPMSIHVDGVPSDDWALLQVSHATGPAGARATFEWRGDRADFGNVRSLLAPGVRLTAWVIEQAQPDGTSIFALFDGFAEQVRADFAGDHRRLLLDARDCATAQIARRRILGIHACGPTGQPVWIELACLAFNKAGRPNRSAEPVTLNGRSTYVFDARPAGAEFWSAADAINYLLAAHLADDGKLVLPSTEQIDGLCAAGPRDLDLGGQRLLDAVELLGRLGNAWFVFEPADGGKWRMRWFGPDGSRVMSLRHQPPGQTMLPAQTDLAGGEFTFEHDNVRHRWIALGEGELAESTWTLLPGWNPALESDDHRLFSRTNADFASVTDVYRRWVLNEAGDWTGPPYNRGPAADLDSLFEGPAMLARRTFEPCLSRDPQGNSYGVFVEFSYDAGQNWQPANVQVEVLSSEAAVRVVDDQLPPPYWQAARAGDLAVRVTACLRSDRPVSVEVDDPANGSGPPLVTHLRRLANFRRQRVDPGSRFFGQVDADERDDRPAMKAALAELIEAARASPAVGRADLPWITAAYQVGDRIRGVAGQELDFGAGDARFPLVARVIHDLDNWQTRLELE